MRCRFMHMADVHLGFKQYGLEERADDFADVFYRACDFAVLEAVDFVLLAGDLFHKRQIDAMTLNRAVWGLEKLRQAKIPVVAVEGNHEMAALGETMGWLEYLATQNLLIRLKPNLRADPLVLDPYRIPQGAYVDVKPGVRVYGLHFTGAAAGLTLNRYAQALSNLPAETAVQQDGTPVAYRIFLAHTGVKDVLPNDPSSPSRSEWRVLDGLVDFIALGHIHKPFDHAEWIYNPGSLETCSADEVAWDERGTLIVDVDTRSVPMHRVRRVRSNRRPYLRLSQHVDGIPTVESLHNHCLSTLRGEHASHAEGTLKPIVDLSLVGSLAFSHQALELEEIRRLAQTELGALHVIIRNLTNPLSSAASDLGDQMSRTEMEALIFSDLYSADQGYSSHADLWARGTQEVKRLALQLAAPSLITDQVDGTLAAVDNAAGGADSAAKAKGSK